MYYLLKRHWSYVSECKVEADTLEEAVEKAENGDAEWVDSEHYLEGQYYGCGEDEDDIDADEAYE